MTAQKRRTPWIAALMALGFAAIGATAGRLLGNRPPPMLAAEVAAVEEGDVVYGDPAAPVVIVEHSSFTCSHCRAFHLNVLPPLLEGVVAARQAVVVFRPFALDAVALAASAGVTCIPSEDGRRRAVAAVFANQERLKAASERTSIDLVLDTVPETDRTAVRTCAEAASTRDRLVRAMMEATRRYGVRATPTVVVGRRVLVGASTPAEVEEALRAELKAHAPAPPVR